MAVRPELVLLRTRIADSWRRFQIHSPKLSRFIANWGWLGLMVAAFTVEPTREYWLALLLFIAAAASAVSSLSHWKGVDGERGFTITARIFGVIISVIILVGSLMWLWGEKGDQHWSRLPEYYAKLVPPIPPPPPALSPFTRHVLAPQQPPGGWVPWWGIVPPNRIRVIANLDPMLPYANRFSVFLVCRVADYSINEKLDTAIEKSTVFYMTPSPMIMEIEMSQQFLNRAYPNKKVNVFIALIPGGVDTLSGRARFESISKLQDVEAMDGALIGPNGITVNLVKRKVLVQGAAPKPPM